MQLEVRKYLADVERAAELAATFTAGTRFDDYMKNDLLRAAADVDHHLVWDIVVGKLPTLRREVAALLATN